MNFYRTTSVIKYRANILLVFGLAGFAIMMLLTRSTHFVLEVFFYIFFFLLSLCVGALGIRLIHALTGGGWGEPLQNHAQWLTNGLPWIFLIALPQFIWMEDLYFWMNRDVMLNDPVLLKKTAFLNLPFFLARSIFYFVTWTGIAFWLDHFNNKRNLAAPLTILYVLAGTFAAIDWIMTLEPHWFSSIFGILITVGTVLTAYSLILLLHILIDRPKNGDVLKDMGNMLLMFVMVWTYLSLSQFLIIWMGNIPEEIVWYLARTRQGWGEIATFLIIFHFFVPFFLLLRRAWKQNAQFLAAVAGGVLFMRITNLAWVIFPSWERPLSQIWTIPVFTSCVMGGILTWALILTGRLRPHER